MFVDSPDVFHLTTLHYFPPTERKSLFPRLQDKDVGLNFELVHRQCLYLLACDRDAEKASFFSVKLVENKEAFNRLYSRPRYFEAFEPKPVAYAQSFPISV